MKKLILSLSIFLFSCGGPTFNVAYKYVPPKDNKNCLIRCKEEYNKCNLNCKKEYQNCLDDARKRAEEIYKKELENYSKELSTYNEAYTTYQRDLLEWNRNYRKLYKDYLFFKKECKKHKHDYYICDRKYQLEEALDTLNRTKPNPPEKPKKPNFSEILSELSSSCSMDCGCDEKYRVCFTSCGGEVVPYKYCVKNCK